MQSWHHCMMKWSNQCIARKQHYKQKISEKKVRKQLAQQKITAARKTTNKIHSSKKELKELKPEVVTAGKTRKRLRRKGRRTDQHINSLHLCKGLEISVSVV